MFEGYRGHPTIVGFYANEEGKIIHKTKRLSIIKIKGTVTAKGYRIFRENNRHKILWHRFVWECFNGIIPDGMQIDHLNTLRDDNRLCNLKLVTPKENQHNPLTVQHHKEAIVKSKGKSVYKLSKTGEIIKRYDSMNDAARDSNLSSGDKISLCCQNKRKSAGGYCWKYA